MRSLAWLCPLLFTLPAQAQVAWTVDDDGPADFNSIQGAIDVAGDGDLIIVEPGAYTFATISGKGLSLVAKGTATLTSSILVFPGQPALLVQDVPAGSTVHVRGFDCSQAFGTDLQTALLENNAGAVSIEDCTFGGDGPSMVVRDSASVTFRGVSIDSPDAFVDTAFGLPSDRYDGVAAESSNLFFYDSQVTGGDGVGSGFSFFFSTPWSHVDGGAAVRLEGGSLLASGCNFTGGNGLPNSEANCEEGGAGGSAIALFGGAQGTLQDNLLAPGVGGSGSCGNPDGPAGLPVEVDTESSALLYFILSRSGSVEAVAEAGAPFQSELSGQPGDQVFAAISPGFGPGLPIPGTALAQHVLAGFELFPVGVIPAGGELNPTFFAPPLPIGFEAQAVHAQFLFFDGFQFHEAGLTTLTVVNGQL